MLIAALLGLFSASWTVDSQDLLHLLSPAADGPHPAKWLSLLHYAATLLFMGAWLVWCFAGAVSSILAGEPLGVRFLVNFVLSPIMAFPPLLYFAICCAVLERATRFAESTQTVERAEDVLRSYSELRKLACRIHSRWSGFLSGIVIGWTGFFAVWLYDSYTHGNFQAAAISFNFGLVFCYGAPATSFLLCSV